MSEIRLSPALTCNLWRQALGFAFSFFSYTHMIAGAVGLGRVAQDRNHLFFESENRYDPCLPLLCCRHAQKNAMKMARTLKRKMSDKVVCGFG